MMARPLGVYVVFCDGKVLHICDGAAEARARVKAYRSGGLQASHKRCCTQQDAEEFTSWWNYRTGVNR